MENKRKSNAVFALKMEKIEFTTNFGRIKVTVSQFITLIFSSSNRPTQIAPPKLFFQTPITTKWVIGFDI